MKKIFTVLVLVFFLFSFGFVNPKAVMSLDQANNQLIKKISRDYTKKFCNGIGFGLSKDSANQFAYKENNLIFNKKISSNSLNRELIANEIAISVVDGCGYKIGLKGEEAIKEFQNQYLSISKSFPDENMKND